MKFSEVIGQQAMKDQLVHMVDQNRLSHALLFLGREGSGALPLALAFAQYILCTGRLGLSAGSLSSPSLFGEPEIFPAAIEADGDSCGVCPSCSKVSALVHPDLHYTYPVVTKKSTEPPVSADYAAEWRDFIKQYPYGNAYDWLQMIGAENKQGNITARECAEINRNLNLKSFESEYKIILIWMPEYLDREGNKLLKIIEEPPEKTLFILVAQDENGILPTILSRTQLIKIPSLTDEEIEEALIERAGIEENKARKIAGVSEGNYREAIKSLQHADEDWQALLRDWLNAILRNGPVSVVKWLDEVGKLGREKQKQFLRYFIHQLEQSIRLSVEESAGVAAEKNDFQIASEDRDFGSRFNTLCGMEAKEAIIRELDKASYYIERNAHGKMLFHALSIRLSYIIKDKSLILVN